MLISARLGDGSPLGWLGPAGYLHRVIRKEQENLLRVYQDMLTVPLKIVSSPGEMVFAVQHHTKQQLLFLMAELSRCRNWQWMPMIKRNTFSPQRLQSSGKFTDAFELYGFTVPIPVYFQLLEAQQKAGKVLFVPERCSTSPASSSEELPTWSRSAKALPAVLHQ